VKLSSWCYGTKKMVEVEGEIVGKRQADLLKVTDCTQKDCPKRGTTECLIGKLREGRWES